MRLSDACWQGFIRFAAFVAAVMVAHAEPILVYDFNETGTNAPSTGSDTTPLYLYATNGVCTDLHAGPGSGTTGQAGDRCLDLSAATGMGSGKTGPLARHLGDNNAIDDLTSFTLCGWYKSPYTTGGYARFFNNSYSGWGWELSSGGGSTLALDILDAGPKGTAIAPDNSFNDLNKWLFFAITYDGTAITNNVRIYRGYLNTTEAEARPAFACVSTNTIDKGKVEETGGNAALVVGNISTYDRPFRGYLDNLRIYGDPDNASGALDETAVQAVWATATRTGTNLLLEYGFNGSGTEAASTGYYTNGLTLRDSADVLTDLHGPAGSGVRGEPWDRALVLTNATGMGNPGTGPVARHATDLDLADTLVSFTASGWYKTSVPGETPANYAMFINNGSGTTGYILQNNGSNGKAIALNVNNVGGCATVNNTFSDANTWVFFAVTYDSTSTTNNARFYRGYRTQAEAGSHALLACVSTNTYLAGAPNSDSAILCVGNRPDRQRPLRGYMDNIRLYGSKRDSSAALDAAAIAAIRSADYPAIRGTLVTVR